MSHYRVLGVPREATRVELRAAYVRAARNAHPDLHRDTDGRTRQRAADRMCSINEAWRVLGDPARRRIYDRQRVAHAAGAARGAGPAPSRPMADDHRPERVPGRAPTGGRGNPLVLLPVGLFGLAMLQFLVGLLAGVPAVLASGAVTFALSLAAFVAAPLIMVAASRPGRRSAVG